ncbi:hypothetical protein HMPREF1608_03158 [Escherichia coli 908525]|uniref:Uncharacterized protein n=1 Tax=Escherichia coli (strain SMS-3-5 / SECEC) TaxID=439855 RepID=B1LMB3_ECOSM|nr:hypothetical protein EcSMS35_0845 [Escherichia coli SMS-3-5]ESD05810.1 hypothetical protein HMPREF1595_03442 [Escherichia coli 907672]ESD69898.1 hypothetical protein HMPREF1608_03158 [Escherichia coli 908525]KDX50510.1 hypothetical protein AC69_2645 [Escherichia coli 2-177-06_S4_C1]
MLIRPTQYLQYIESAGLCRPDKALTPHQALTKRICQQSE